MRIDIRHNLPACQKDVRRLAKHLRDKAMMRAMNRGAVTARAHAIRAVSKEAGIKQKTVRAATRIRKASPRQLWARITFMGNRLNLIKFDARTRADGVSARPWGKRRVFPGTFIAPDSRGGERVFKRRGAARLPVEGVYGPGIASTFERVGVAVARSAGLPVVVAEFRRQVELFRSRTARSGPRASGSGAGR